MKKPHFPYVLNEQTELDFYLNQYIYHQFAYARSFELGICLDQDPECVHQYRVSLRRIRSLTKLLATSLPPDELAIIKPDLKKLMKRTNQLRDLDVFILDMQNFITSSNNKNKQLTSIYHKLKHQRLSEHHFVSQWLSSRDYQATTALIGNSLKRLIALDHSYCQSRVGSYANHKIHLQSKTVKKAAKSITATSKDKRIHALRIKCKNLRYLLEFFSPLYPKPMLANTIFELKKMQNLLGTFNDTSKQIEMLSNLNSTISLNPKEQKKLTVLIEKAFALHSKQRKVIACHTKPFCKNLTSTFRGLSTIT